MKVSSYGKSQSFVCCQIVPRAVGYYEGKPSTIRNTPAPVSTVHAEARSYQPCLGRTGYLSIWGHTGLNSRAGRDHQETAGVFFGAEGAHMLSPGDVVVAMSDDLGGGYLYGRPEHLAKAFDAAGATQGSAEAEYLFVKKRSCLWLW